MDRLSSDSFVIAEWEAEVAEYWIAPLHRHLCCDEAWYVLEGALEFTVDGDLSRVEAGEGKMVPAGAVHSYRNASDSATRYLIVMTPKTASLVEEIHKRGDYSREGLQRLFAEYDAELI